MSTLLNIFGGGCAAAITGTILWCCARFFFPHFPLARQLQAYPWWCVALVFGVGGAIIAAVATVRDRRRMRYNREAADSIGADFSEHVSAAEIRAWPAVSLFGGQSPRADCRMRGTYRNATIDVLDFRYEVSTSTDNGTSTSTYTQTVFHFPDAARESPAFTLRPRGGLVGRLVEFLGFPETSLAPPDVNDPESAAAYERFRGTYRLAAAPVDADGTEAARVFHPLLVGWLAEHPGWSLESHDAELTAWRSHAVFSGTERLTKLDELADFLALMKAGDTASARTAPSMVLVDSRDSVGAIAGLMGLWIGLMSGATVGGIIGSLLLAAASQAVPGLGRRFPVMIGLFLGCAVLVALAGARIGWKRGRGSPRLRRFANRFRLADAISNPDRPS